MPDPWTDLSTAIAAAISNTVAADHPDAATGQAGFSDELAQALWQEVGAYAPGHLHGGKLSNHATAGKFNIAALTARSDDQSLNLALGSGWNKTSAAWASGTGNGALDTGTIAAGWYWVHVIGDSTAAVADDVLISLSEDAPSYSRATAYDTSRNMGALYYTGSDWRNFIQTGDHFGLDVPIRNDAYNPTVTTAKTITTSAPPGREAEILLSCIFHTSAPGYISFALMTDLVTQTDTLPSASVHDLLHYDARGSYSAVRKFVLTNSSSQIRLRWGGTVTRTTSWLQTHGWRDTRGRLD